MELLFRLFTSPVEQVDDDDLDPVQVPLQPPVLILLPIPGLPQQHALGSDQLQLLHQGLLEPHHLPFEVKELLLSSLDLPLSLSVGRELLDLLVRL